ncbi:MAG: arginine deiminase family protein [Candidatus Omnitrophica bacterium]|jgi:N-dimethylarginine dimethylaminohydrolase|nr:arginine deiminase family protein [Candidatus Omnitrophota bacterium]MDD5079442.1 arginine deiminase family protein [Candidatus Omnitrophota bacterium]
MRMPGNNFPDSEYKRLRRVLLYQPGPEIANITDPESVLHLRRIDYPGIKKEYRKIQECFRRLSIKVFMLKPRDNPDRAGQNLFNLIYTRDLFFMSPKGAIIAKMASSVRSKEPGQVRKLLKGSGIPVIGAVKGQGTFEAADALWLNNKLVVVGVGRRTNAAGFKQVKKTLAGQGIRCISVPAPKITLHLLGSLQLIDSDLALVRADYPYMDLFDLLRNNKIKIIKVPANAEVKEKQAMNIVCVAPRKIIMPADCPRTREFYRKRKIKIAAELKLAELANGAGGLACATAVISRDIN